MNSELLIIFICLLVYLWPILVIVGIPIAIIVYIKNKKAESIKSNPQNQPQKEFGEKNISPRTNEINAKVIEFSPKIQALEKLNEEIQFHRVDECIDIFKEYDNRWHYNKIEPVYLMLDDVRNNLETVAQYIKKIQENRQNKIIYDSRVEEIRHSEYTVDYESIGISESIFKYRENKLFEEMVAHQYTDCVIYVRMTYSSPKGKTYLNKYGKFNFDQLVTSFNRVSHSRLDYETYQGLAAVERGKVSNSLRYDILRRDKFRCVLCGASADEDGVKLHVDHIIPIAKGGKSVPNNLRTLCEGCNMGKSDKLETDVDNYGY